MKNLLVLFTVALLGAATGCDAAKEACEKYISAACKKAISCSTASTKPTEAQCSAELMKKYDCSKAVLGNDDVDKCVADIEKQACNVSSDPASCADVVKIQK